ncbi:cytochrome P450 protein [Rutstroemia sp. NJR-2017a WRK4]|nr:cytochrome P450 protein [Rutstroemia sp. NJR-2017a WRK4]
MLQQLLDRCRREVVAYSWSILGICLICLAANRAFVTASIYSKRPENKDTSTGSDLIQSNVLISGASLRWGKWWSTIQYVLRAPQSIQTAYDKADGKPFAIPAIDEYQVYVSSEEHIQEVNNAPQEYLSSHAVMADRLKMKYTFYGFELGSKLDPNDKVPRRVLKTLLRTSIPRLRPKIQRKIEQGFDRTLSKATALDGGDNEDYLKAALRYGNDVILSMELCRYLPSFMVPYVCPAIMSFSASMDRIAGYVRKVVVERLRQQDESKPLPESSTTPGLRSVERIVQQVIALTFASAHQMPLVLSFAIRNLCLHPEYIEPLTQEVNDTLSQPPESRYKHMPLLESFMRESSRINPLDGLTIHRKVMQPFTFSSGTHVPVGNIICVPQEALMRDSKYYENPLTFDGFRFVVPEDRESDEPQLKYTDIAAGFPFWGTFNKACPGRWYASEMLKQTLAHLLMNYEFRLSENNKKMTLQYTTMVIPTYGVKIQLRKLV